MKHVLYILLLVSAIAAVLYLDNYLRRETDFMKELANINAYILNDEVEQLHNRVELLSNRCSDKVYQLSDDLKYLEQFKDTSSPIVSFESLEDSLKMNLRLEPRQNIWPSIDELERLQAKEYVKDWLNNALNFLRDSCDIKDDENLELVVPKLKVKKDSIHLQVLIGYLIDSPYYDPIYGYKIDENSIVETPK